MAEIEEAVGTTAELIEGGGGVFDVTVDGERIYSKHSTGRFPEAGEVAKLLADR